MSELSTRTLVLRQFAAMRRQGVNASVALDQLVQGLPPGAARDDCVLAGRALAAGAARSESDFTRVLTTADAAPSLAEALAESLEARLDALDALRAPVFLLQLIVAGPLVLLAGLGWLVDFSFLGTEIAMPGPTRLLIELSDSLRWVGVPLAAGLAFAVHALRTKYSPGFRPIIRAVGLLEVSTRPEPELDLHTLGLDQLERQVLLGLQMHRGVATGLHTLAAELRREGRASVARFRTLAPVVAMFVVVQVYLSVLIALYLPIFAIAGAIK
ncbi:MAG: hypothetical protein Q8K32_02190 [Archangium sp.]|nr:hypothetical protein [Archangium sp.]